MIRSKTAFSLAFGSSLLIAFAAAAQVSATGSAAGGVASPGMIGPTTPGTATPGSTLPALNSPTSVVPNAATPGVIGRTDPTNPNNPNDSLTGGPNRTANGLTDTTNALGSPTAERADATWCRGAGLSAGDSRGCVARMNTAATDQQRADIQATYRGRAGAGAGASAATRNSGGSRATNSRLDSGLSIGAGQQQ